MPARLNQGAGLEEGCRKRKKREGEKEDEKKEMWEGGIGEGGGDGSRGAG